MADLEAEFQRAEEAIKARRQAAVDFEQELLLQREALATPSRDDEFEAELQRTKDAVAARRKAARDASEDLRLEAETLGGSDFQSIRESIEADEKAARDFEESMRLQDEALGGSSYELAKDAARRRREAAERGLADIQERRAADGSTSVRGWFADMSVAVVRGPIKAAKATYSAIAGVAETFVGMTGDVRLNIGNDRPWLELQSPSQARAANAGTDLVEEGATAVLDTMGAPTTVAGSMTEGISQFVAGMIPAAKLAKGVQFLQKGGTAITVTRSLGLGAVVSGVAFEGDEANLANLMQQFPVLQNPVSDFLATDLEDSEVVGRLKNAVTDAAGGLAFEGLLAGLRAMKHVRQLKAEALAEVPPAVPAVAPDVTPEAPPVLALDDTATAPAARPEVTPAAPGAPEAKPASLKELAPEERYESLRQRLGITDAKMQEFRARVVSGEIKPENVADLIAANPERIDWTGVTDAEDMVGLLNTLSRVLGDTVGEAAGSARVPLEDIAKQSAEIGGSYDDALRTWQSSRNLAAHIQSARAAVNGSAAQLQRLAKTVANGQGTAQDMLDLVVHDKRHALLQVVVKGTKSEIGRALRVMREGVAVNEAALTLSNGRRLREARAAKEAADKAGTQAALPTDGGKLLPGEVAEALQSMGLKPDDVVNLAKEIAKRESLTATNAAARSGLWLRFQDRLATLYINNILSGVPTMTLNVASGFYKMIESSFERYGASLMRGDKFDRIAAHRAAVATWTSWRAAFKLAGEAWKEGLPQTDVLARAEVAARAGADASLVEKVITAPSRAILTIDEFFKHIFYQQELTQRAVEVAAAAARLEKTPAGADRTFADVLRETLENPPDDLRLDAIESARYNTFQANLESDFGKGLIRLTNGSPITKLIVPFVRTPTNILKQALLERSPLALLRVKFWKEVDAGGRKGREAALRAAVGTMAAGVVWSWADEGNLTGSRVGRPGLPNTADMDGAPPYSIKLGGTWYQYNRLDPIGTVLGLTADLRHLWNSRTDRNENSLTSDDMDIIEGFANLLGILTENVTDKTYFKGLSDFVQAMEAGASEQGGRITAYVNTLASNLVPFSSLQRNFARTHDEYAREAFTFTDKLKAQTPGLSDELPPRHDLLGRPVTQTDRLGADWASPFLIGKDDPDPTARAFAELEMNYRLPDKDIAGVRLDAEQYSLLTKVRGEYLRTQIMEWLDAGEWDDLTKAQRINKVRQWQTYATREAEAQVLERWPALALTVEMRMQEVRALRSGEIR